MSVERRKRGNSEMGKKRKKRGVVEKGKGEVGVDKQECNDEGVERRKRE